MREIIWLTWLNNLGGFDYWFFTGWKDHNIEVEETGTATKNTFPRWPKSYGAFADTIRKQTFRKTRKSIVVRSQKLSRENVELLGEAIKSSPLVQIITDRRTKRTVIVDEASIVIRREKDKLHSLNFTITYTDEIPSQTA